MSNQRAMLSLMLIGEMTTVLKTLVDLELRKEACDHLTYIQQYKKKKKKTTVLSRFAGGILRPEDGTSPRRGPRTSLPRNPAYGVCMLMALQSDRGRKQNGCIIERAGARRKARRAYDDPA